MNIQLVNKYIQTSMIILYFFPKALESSTREKPIHETHSKLKEAHKAIDKLRQELFDSKKAKSEAERMEFGERK